MNIKHRPKSLRLSGLTDVCGKVSVYFAYVVLSDANSNDAGKSGSIELQYPNGVRILLPQGMHDAEELMSYVKAYGE